MNSSIKDLAKESVALLREVYGDDYTPLHKPVFEGNERQYLIDCIDSNFVSSVGAKVTEFEERIAEFTGNRYAIATVNGTAALHVAIQLAGVKPGDEVISQALTFIATCNAISYAGAEPLFVDVDLDTMGLSPAALKNFLERNADKSPRGTFNRLTGKKLAACVPMHTFGFPCRIEEIRLICDEWGIPLIEDAAESLGSYVGNSHTGTFGLMSTLSFNGNKVITTGGGGMIITDDTELAKRAKHITTTAKVPHSYEFLHDQIGYNYRMPNLNATLGCAQMERIEEFLAIKIKLADKWAGFFGKKGIKFFSALEENKANNWLNTIVLESREDRDEFLKLTNDSNIMTRPIWTLMSKLPMFKDCQKDSLENSLWLEDRVVNIPSSVPDGAFKKLDK